MFRFLFLLVLLLILPDLYLWQMYTKHQPGIWRTGLLCLPTVVTLVLMVMMLCQVRVMTCMQWTFILLICIAVPKLVFVGFDLLSTGVGRVFPSTRSIGMRIALCVSVLVAAAQVYGTVYGWKRLERAETDIHVAGLPRAFEGFRIVQISDLHLGTNAGDTTFVSRVVDSVNVLKPDLIVFTGDIVNSSWDELPPYITVLSRLSARDGVISILGNHDYCLYNPALTQKEQTEHLRHIIDIERAMGWKLLLNDHQLLTKGRDTIVVAGVENIGKPPFPERGNLSRALRGIDPHLCTILLSHDPWHWHHGVVRKHPVALTLSGHTHALQMQFGKFSPASWFMKEWGGLYRDGSQQLFVSTGLGGSVPYRLGAWPKIDVLTLRR